MFQNITRIGIDGMICPDSPLQSSAGKEVRRSYQNHSWQHRKGCCTRLRNGNENAWRQVYRLIRSKDPCLYIQKIPHGVIDRALRKRHQLTTLGERITIAANPDFCFILQNCEQLSPNTPKAWRNHAEALLLSGGLDSSILAAYRNTLSVGFGRAAPDLPGGKRKILQTPRWDCFWTKTNGRISRAGYTDLNTDPIWDQESASACRHRGAKKSDGYSTMTATVKHGTFCGYNHLPRYHDMQRFRADGCGRLCIFSSATLGEHGKNLKSKLLSSTRYLPCFGKKKSMSEKKRAYNGKVGKFIREDVGRTCTIWYMVIEGCTGARSYYQSLRIITEEMIDDLTLQIRKE